MFFKGHVWLLFILTFLLTLFNLQWKDIRRDSWHRYRFDGEDSNDFCHPSAVLRALSKYRRDSTTNDVSRNAVVTVDVGDVTLWSSLCLNLAGGSRTLYSERLGTMGYALNAAVAGILSVPKGPAGAVVLTGDGGFQMSLQELATFQQMKREGDKLLCIVFDNQVLGRVAFGFDKAAGCEMRELPIRYPCVMFRFLKANRSSVCLFLKLMFRCLLQMDPTM